jgi:NADPH:quinone reductase-like Zn-dependent oxidoreductase
MQHTGALVKEWPAVLGSDACTVVLETGEGCTKLKKGDYVYGCMRVGQNQFSPFQETFLVDEDLTFKKSAGISMEEACTIGGQVLVSLLPTIGGFIFVRLQASRGLLALIQIDRLPRWLFSLAAT